MVYLPQSLYVSHHMSSWLTLAVWNARGHTRYGRRSRSRSLGRYSPGRFSPGRSNYSYSSGGRSRSYSRSPSPTTGRCVLLEGLQNGVSSGVNALPHALWLVTLVSSCTVPQCCVSFCGLTGQIRRWPSTSWTAGRLLSCACQIAAPANFS